MYSVAYLPIALRDLQEIVRYIADSLHNPTAAMQTAEGIVAAIERLGTMPYHRAVYAPILPLSHEFRTIRYKSHVASARASPHTMEKGPHTTLERLIQ